MNIKRTTPDPVIPPDVFQMEFTMREGWALVMMFRNAYFKYPGAANRNKWLQWATDLEILLKRK